MLDTIFALWALVANALRMIIMGELEAMLVPKYPRKVPPSMGEISTMPLVLDSQITYMIPASLTTSLMGRKLRLSPYRGDSGLP
ncbi:hypothetical protein IMSAGC003_02095 [Lachnospiraceae bacterium]|nr:hypothetical protein IMSAGC003_02095 [Lachnospiraceae bacterium]